MTQTKLTFFEWIIAVIAGSIATVLIFSLMIPVSLFACWVRVQLWDWFAVPYLHLPSVPFWAMYGLGTLIGTFYYSKGKTNEYKQTWQDGLLALLVNIFGWLIALGFGYIIHTYLLR
jgi:hypothetical protein